MGNEEKSRFLYMAVILLGNYGYEKVTLGQIALEAGLEPELVRAEYPSKEAVLLAVAAYIGDLYCYRPTEEELLRQLETKTPEQILGNFALFCDEIDDVLILSIFRLMYAEQSRSREMTYAAREKFLTTPVESLTFTLDFLVRQGAIPPCDSRALAELWFRTALIYGMQASHKEFETDYGEYMSVIGFVIEMAVRGVRPVAPELLEVNWETRPHFAPDVEPDQMGRKGEILLTALDLFSRYGYGTVTMRQIASASGVEGAHIYSFYTSKGALMREITRGILNGCDQYRFSNPAFRAAVEKSDRGRIILSLSSSYPPVQEELVRKLYRTLFQEQYFNEDLRDFFMSSIYRDCYTITQTLEELEKGGRIGPCPKEQIAIAYVYTMCSMTICDTVFPEDSEEQGRLRTRVVAQLVSLIVNGYMN